MTLSLQLALHGHWQAVPYHLVRLVWPASALLQVQGLVWMMMVLIMMMIPLYPEQIVRLMHWYHPLLAAAALQIPLELER